MTRHHLAAELASRVAGTFATDTMTDRLAADDTLMDLAKADMNAAAEAVINLAIETVSAAVAIKRDATTERAA